MQAFQHIVALTAPLFLLVLLGYGLTAWGRWPKEAGDWLTRFVFGVAVPTLLFRLMSDFSKLPAVDWRLLLAYFGGCLAVFVVGRLVAYGVFAMDGTSQSVFALGGIFSNNVLLGVPLAHVALGDDAMPSVSLIVLFNALLLWTLVTVSVEWARNRTLSASGLGATAIGVVKNPIVGGILAGTAYGFVGIPLPGFVDATLALVAQAAVPLSLIALGMGLAEYGIRGGWRPSVAIAAIKLVVLPLTVWLVARAIGLPPTETRAITVMAALPVGANVYLMSKQFDTLGGPVASSLVLSTAIASLTVPVVLALSAAGAP